MRFWHGWPLNAGAWDGRMLFLAQHGRRVIAHDRRSLRRGVQEHTDTGETGLSDQLPGEDPGADPTRLGARPGRIQ